MKPSNLLIFQIAMKFSAILVPFLNHTNGMMVSDGMKRYYLLYVPDSYDPNLPAPLVISLHGYSEWPAHQMQISHWNRLADRYGFIVVYPCATGAPLRWHALGQRGDDPGLLRDVAFISELIDRLGSQYNLDPMRIYVNGLSNGGGMSFVLSAKLSERIAAFGSVAGAYMFPWSEFKPSRAVPGIIFHGTEDPIVPYSGGASGTSGIQFPSIPDWAATLAQKNGCSPEPKLLQPLGQVEGYCYQNLSTGADVVMYTIHGGGHSWPGGGSLPKFIVGEINYDIDATEVMWDFFQAHPLGY